MKKIILAIGIATGVAVASSYGQGTVAFGNSGGSRISTNSAVGGAATGLVSPNLAQTGGAMNFYYALFWSTSQTTVGGSQTAAINGTAGVYAFSASGWNDGSSTTTYSTNTTAGRLQAAVPNSDGSASVANLAGGTPASFVVIGWSANIGSTIAPSSVYGSSGP